MLDALIVAYSCEPGRGSEPGAGWGLVTAAATFARCVVLVAPEHIEALDAYTAAHPELAAEFVAVPEPRYRRWVGDHRVGRFLAYLGWLRNARKAARRLLGLRHFDVAHHATFSVYWLPSALTGLALPLVWGPVGGAVTTPRRLWPLLGWRGLGAEILDWIGVRAGALLPATRRTWREAAVCVAQNEATRDRLPAGLRDVTAVWNHALFVDVPPHPPARRGAYLVWAGAFESRKGPALAVRALVHAPGAELVMVGDGPELEGTRRLARELGIDHRIDFRGRVPRPALAELLAGAAGAVFTGLREEGGLALAEALAVGTPVIVLDHGGAGTIARAAVDPGRVALVAPATVSGTARRLGAVMARFAADPPPGAGPLLDADAAQTLLHTAYRRAAARPGP